MPPIRRYLRISKHSVLECRIFLENPADGPRWLLNHADPALPRVFEAIRPLVLPKLREENERAKGKGKKKKTVKDVIVKDEFEVSVFLTDVATRHTLLVKQKTFKDKTIGQNGNAVGDPVLLREDSSDDDADRIRHIPQASDADDEVITTGVRKRTRTDDEDDEAQEEKKMGFNTTYDGFSIWGKVLCLLVERKGGPGKKSGTSSNGGAQALMQEWITASQMQDDDF